MYETDQRLGEIMAERRKQGLLWIDTGENMSQQVYARRNVLPSGRHRGSADVCTCSRRGRSRLIIMKGFAEHRTEK